MYVNFLSGYLRLIAMLVDNKGFKLCDQPYALLIIVEGGTFTLESVWGLSSSEHRFTLAVRLRLDCWHLSMLPTNHPQGAGSGW